MDALPRVEERLQESGALAEYPTRARILPIDLRALGDVRAHDVAAIESRSPLAPDFEIIPVAGTRVVFRTVQA